MTDAPERIFARQIEVDPCMGMWEGDPLLMSNGTEYVRADLIPAMLAEAEQRGREAGCMA
jgi:hypothetical protein